MMASTSLPPPFHLDFCPFHLPSSDPSTSLPPAFHLPLKGVASTPYNPIALRASLGVGARTLKRGRKARPPHLAEVWCGWVRKWGSPIANDRGRQKPLRKALATGFAVPRGDFTGHLITNHVLYA
jgi:hypothetical protein